MMENSETESNAEMVFGDDEPTTITEVVNVRSLDPVLPRRIYKGADERYYTVVAGPVHLPEGIAVGTRLLHIDSKNVLYMRQHKANQKREEKKIVTLQHLLSSMEEFYSNFTNFAKHCISGPAWFPNIGEVVVVRVERLMPSELSSDGYFVKWEYQRAVIMEIKQEGFTVKLLDDYGIGGVSFSSVLRIVGAFAELPPQMFWCELAGIEMINFRKLVQRIVHDSPIQNCWPDNHMIDVETTWLGELSKNNLPLVEVIIYMRESSQKYISLKTHVFQNVQSILQPFNHLVEESCEFRTLNADENGFLWVKFVEDDELDKRMQLALEKLVPFYHEAVEYTGLTVDRIFPKDDRKRCKLNCKKLFAVLLPVIGGASKKNDEKTLYRVIVKEADPSTNNVKVYCVDHHSTHEVNAWELVPLCALNPDICYIPPLVFKVHLYPVKRLDKDDMSVANILYAGKLKMMLVQEWPRNICPPEVYIDSTDFPRVYTAEVIRQQQKKPGSLLEFGHVRNFILTGRAEAASAKDMKYLGDLISKRAKQLEKEKEEEEIKYTSFENQKFKKRLQRLAPFTFVCDNFRFVWSNDNDGSINDGTNLSVRSAGASSIFSFRGLEKKRSVIRNSVVTDNDSSSRRSIATSGSTCSF